MLHRAEETAELSDKSMSLWQGAVTKQLQERRPTTPPGDFFSSVNINLIIPNYINN